MKLLKLLFIPVSALLLVACQDDEGARPSVNQANKNVLGLVVPHSNNGELQKVIFLKDGRRVNPVSGMPDFENTDFGSKYLITFKEGKTVEGILNVAVTAFSDAQDSTFIPSDTVFIPGDTIFAPVDSIFIPPTDTITNPGDSTENPIDSVGTIVFKGTFVIFNMDSTTGNGFVISDTLTLTLSNNTFELITNGDIPLSSSGTFIRTADKFNFEDATSRPPETDNNLALDGCFNYFVYDRYLSLFTYRNGVYIAYYLHR